MELQIVERNQALGITVIVIVVASLGFIAVWNPPPAPDVRIGYLTKDLHQLALQVAIENGYFEREGLTVLIGHQNIVRQYWLNKGIKKV